MNNHQNTTSMCGKEGVKYKIKKFTEMKLKFAALFEQN